ncbi:hypothetical protein ST47_g3383 [Ascochyta rabiei]|uniref:Uncharacterized protein n=1 Tax=Didymella rabiei TaxID=5454 RepID=A0A163HTG0_DIDRA|nr:hypothetical protein ST47_g3383 [Ascochyta rabiei]
MICGSVHAKTPEDVQTLQSPGLIRARPRGGATMMEQGLHPAKDGGYQWRPSTRLVLIMEKDFDMYDKQSA